MHLSLTMRLPQQILLTKGRLLTLKHVNKLWVWSESCQDGTQPLLPCCLVPFSPWLQHQGHWRMLCIHPLEMSGSGVHVWMLSTPAHLGPGPSWHSHLVLWDRPVLTAQQMSEAFPGSFMFVVEDSSLNTLEGWMWTYVKTLKFAGNMQEPEIFPLCLGFPFQEKSCAPVLGVPKTNILVKTSIWMNCSTHIILEVPFAVTFSGSLFQVLFSISETDAVWSTQAGLWPETRISE